MSRELQRYGFPLPQFGKIGGILAGQLPIDEAEHHAALIAVNRATEEGDCHLMLQVNIFKNYQLNFSLIHVSYLYRQWSTLLPSSTELIKL